MKLLHSIKRKLGCFKAPGRSGELKERLWKLIVKLRRGVDTEAAWAQFRRCLHDNGEELLASLNTRELISVCDTFADFGDSVESRNAMLVSVMVTMEKVSQSYLLWRLGYSRRTFDICRCASPRRVPLWDGMDSFDLQIGDVTNNMFCRLEKLLTETPCIHRIFREVLARMRTHETVLGSLNRFHGHVFETDTRWRGAPAYDGFRASGRIPAWKKDG